MTNQQFMAGLPAKDCYAAMKWVMLDYGRRFTSTPEAVIGWLKQEAIVGNWQKVGGYVTAGGDPVWKCPKCGWDEHVYGIEHPSGEHMLCEVCGSFNYYGYTGGGRYATEDRVTDD